MARNKRAGEKTGRSKSAIHYQNNAASRAAKAKVDKAINARPEQVQKRVEANRARRLAKKAGPVGKNTDMSHTKSGRLVKENRSTNRARNRGRK